MSDFDYDTWAAELAPLLLRASQQATWQAFSHYMGAVVESGCELLVTFRNALHAIGAAAAALNRASARPDPHTHAGRMALGRARARQRRRILAQLREARR